MNVALSHPGIFRLSGGRDKVEQFRLHIDRGDFNCEDFSIDVITTTLKQYLQGLPEPILTNFLYPRFITVSTISDHELQMTYLSSLVNTLPPSHLDLLRYLIQFLLKVIANEETNKMSLQNIAIVFGPILMQTNSDDAQTMIAHANLVTTITELLITHHTKIFSVSCFLIYLFEKFLIFFFFLVSCSFYSYC